MLAMPSVSPPSRGSSLVLVAADPAAPAHPTWSGKEEEGRPMGRGSAPRSMQPSTTWPGTARVVTPRLDRSRPMVPPCNEDSSTLHFHHLLIPFEH